MTDQTAGPAFNMAHANLAAQRTGHPIDITTRYLEAEADGTKDIAFALGDHFGFEGMPFGRVCHEIAMALYEIRRNEAIEQGRFWTIRAALYNGRAFMTIRNAVETEDDELAFISQHENCYGILAHEEIGERIEVKRAAVTLVNVDELVIRFI